MDQLIEAQIKECEEQLKQAMLDSNVAVLDKLLSPELMFTNHLGRLMSKQDDLDAHQSGILSIADIQLSGQKINLVGDVAIVTVQAKISGCFAEVDSVSVFRFTRVWSKQSDMGWQIIAGHSSVVA